MNALMSQFAVGLKVDGETRWFRPQEDITTYELACCMAVMLQSLHQPGVFGKPKEAFDALPDEAKRHFE